MTPSEYKQIEGQRIQQVLAAVGALPAAMLVFGDGPRTAAEGAPLFMAAIILVIASLMNWNYTDAAYHLDTVEADFPEERRAEVDAWRGRLLTAAYKFQHRTYGYAIASLLASSFGVAAVYSTLSSGIAVETGFILTVVVAFAASWDIVRLGMIRNQLLREVRDLQT